MRLIPVLILGGVVACSSSPMPAPSPLPPPAPTTATLRGTVTTKDGPANGAIIEVLDGANRGTSVASGVDGSYQLTGLSRGSFGLRIAWRDYVTDEQRVELLADQTIDTRLVKADVQRAGDLTVMWLQTTHQFQFSSPVQNRGDACADNLHGTLTLVTELGPTFQLPWTLPRLAPNATASYTACCVDDRYLNGTATLQIAFDSVKCP